MMNFRPSILLIRQQEWHLACTLSIQQCNGITENNSGKSACFVQRYLLHIIWCLYKTPNYTGRHCL